MGKVFGLAILALVGYLLFWPVTIEPQVWQPPQAPAAEGVFAPNQELQKARRIAAAMGAGGEGVAVGPDGWFYTGLRDGRIMRVAPDGQSHELVVDTGGRPLGMEFAADGRLIVADAGLGLIAVKDGQIETLLTEVNGLALGFADDLAISRAQIVYLSDASSRFGHKNVRADFFEHGANGRLVSYNLLNGEAAVLEEGLYFANGIALAPDNTYLLLNETSRYQVRRYWLQGPYRGQSEVVLDNLPGFPDNITTASDGHFWLALYGPRSAELDQLLDKPFLRKIVWRLPEILQPGPKHVAQVLKISGNGQVLGYWRGEGGDTYAPITSALEHQGQLILGSLSAEGLALFDLAPQP